jgi:hypothetical protein
MTFQNVQERVAVLFCKRSVLKTTISPDAYPKMKRTPLFGVRENMGVF